MPSPRRRPTPVALAARAAGRLFDHPQSTALERAYATYRRVLEAYFHGRATAAEVGAAHKPYRIEASLEVDRHAHEPKPWEGLHAYDCKGYAAEGRR